MRGGSVPGTFEGYEEADEDHGGGGEEGCSGVLDECVAADGF